MVKTRGSKRKSDVENAKEELEKQEGNFTAPPHQVIFAQPHAKNSLTLSQKGGKRMSKVKEIVTFDLSEAEKPTDKATLADKHSERNSVAIQQTKQSEDGHVPGTSVQATANNSTIQSIQPSEAIIHANKSQNEKETSHEEDGKANVAAAEENVLLVTEKSDELHLLEKLGPPTKAPNFNLQAAGVPSGTFSANDDTVNKTSKCFAGSTQHTNNADETTSQGGDTVASNNLTDGPGASSSNCLLGSSLMQQATSFNLTEIAEQMVNADLYEVDSFGSEANFVSVRGYKVKAKHASLLDYIIVKYGDIAANCSLGSVAVRSFCLDLLCDDIKKLMDTKFIDITEVVVEEMLAHVRDFEKASIEIGWLKKRLYEISEAKQAIQLLRTTSDVKQHQAEWMSKLQNMRNQLEVYTSELAVKQAEFQALEQKINDARRKISVADDEVKKVEMVIADNKAKLKRVVKFGSLVHGLIET